MELDGSLLAEALLVQLLLVHDPRVHLHRVSVVQAKVPRLKIVTTIKFCILSWTIKVLRYMNEMSNVDCKNA